MKKFKEIYIEIDESGTFSELPSKSKNENYFFLTCSFISDSLELKKMRNPFHYKNYVFNHNIETSSKSRTLIDLATKIEKQNVFYSICKIDKSQFNDEDYEIEGKNILINYFYNLLKRLTKNNDLTVNVFYDKGQKPVSSSLYFAIEQFKKSYTNKITLYSRQSPSHGYADYLASIEKVKMKKAKNKLGKVEKELYKDDLLKIIINRIDKKNLDKIKFKNFEHLISKK